MQCHFTAVLWVQTDSYSQWTVSGQHMGPSIKAFPVTAQGTQGPANNSQPQWTPAYSGLHLATGVRVPGLDTVVQRVGGCHTFHLHTPLFAFFITPKRLALKWVLKVRAAPPHASVAACVPQPHHVSEMKRPEQPSRTDYMSISEKSFHMYLKKCSCDSLQAATFSQYYYSNKMRTV